MYNGWYHSNSKYKVYIIDVVVGMTCIMVSLCCILESIIGIVYSGCNSRCDSHNSLYNAIL